MNIRKYGLLRISVVLVLTLAASEAVVRKLENSRHAISKARSSYISGLAQTRAQLASQLYELTHDPVLISNLNGQLSYSVSRSLEGEIHPGSFDFYIIFDENCHPVAKSTFFPIPTGLCQKSATDHWRWYSLDNKPAMFLLKSRTDIDKPFYIGAGRFLSKDWLHSFPGLEGELERAHLATGVFSKPALCRWPRICSEFNASAWVEGRDANGLALASLLSKNRSFSFLRPWLVSAKPLSNPLALPLLLLIGLAGILEFVRRRFVHTKIQETHDLFLKWCQNPLDSQLSTPFVPWLQRAQKSLMTVVKQCADRNSALAKKIDELEHEHLCIKEKLSDNERALSEHIPYSVLSTHIARSGTSVQQALAAAHDGSRDLASVLEKGVLSVNRKILDLLRVWQNGITMRGERHYMRSLYEQEGRQEGESLLRSEINRLYSLAEQSGDAVLHALGLVKRLQVHEHETSTVIDAWSQLAGKISDPTLSLAKIGETAAAIIQVERKQRVAFVSKFTPGLALALPVPTVLSAFFLLFKAIKEGLRDVGEDETLIYQAHKRQKQDQFILALSITNERGKVPVCVPQEDLLARASQMLQAWDIQCQAIHRPESGAYLILRGKASLLIAGVDTLPELTTHSSSRADSPTFQPNA